MITRLFMSKRTAVDKGRREIMYYPLLFEEGCDLGTGVVRNGRLRGSTFRQVIGINPEGFCGCGPWEGCGWDSAEFRVDGFLRDSSDTGSFFILRCLDGSFEVRAGGYCATAAAGDSVFIPAALGCWEIYGTARGIKDRPLKYYGGNYTPVK